MIDVAEPKQGGAKGIVAQILAEGQKAKRDSARAACKALVADFQKNDLAKQALEVANADIIKKIEDVLAGIGDSENLAELLG